MAVRCALVLLAWVFTTLLVRSPACAQAATAGVTGTLSDASGRPVAGARLELRGQRTYTAISDGAGGFSVQNVVPGTYALRATKPGYQAVTQSGLVLSDGAVLTVSLTLPLATLQTIASVKSAAGGPHFNATTASVAVVTSQNFADQAQTQVTQVLNQIPGVRISLPGGSTNGAAPGSVTVPTIRGAASYETASLIDGHPLAVATYGDYITSYLSSFMFGSIEVVKGPGSDALEVNNAINGTINFRTLDPTATPVPAYGVGFTTNGGQYANVGLQASTLDGRLGYVFDVSVINDPSALNGKRVLIDPTNGFLGGPNGKSLSGSASYSNVGTTESNIQTGYSLLACCYTLTSNFYNTSELLKLRYQITPSITATVSYLDGQTVADQNGNTGNITEAQFMPGSGYSGALHSGAQQVMYLFPGAPNTEVDNEPIFQAELSSALGNDTILARYYHASLYRETQQGTGPGILDAYPLTLYGSSNGFSKPFNGLTAPIDFQDYFNESELDKLGGWSFQYQHPFGQNTLTFGVDQNTTQAQAYELSTFTSVSIPQGSSQLFTTLQAHANLQLSPTVTAMLADYANIYRSTYATNCPFAGGFSNCAIDGSNVTFATSTTSHNDPRFGFVWQPRSSLAVRFAGGSAIAPPYLDLLSHRLGLVLAVLWLRQHDRRAQHADTLRARERGRLLLVPQRRVRAARHDVLRQQQLAQRAALRLRLLHGALSVYAGAGPADLRQQHLERVARRRADLRRRLPHPAGQRRYRGHARQRGGAGKLDVPLNRALAPARPSIRAALRAAPRGADRGAATPCR